MRHGRTTRSGGAPLNEDMKHSSETQKLSAVRWLVVACCLTFSHSEILIAEVPSFTQQAFALPASAESLVIADLNGDNLNDLVT